MTALAVTECRIVYEHPQAYRNALAVPLYRLFHTTDGHADARVRFHLVDEPDWDAKSFAQTAARGYPFAGHPIVNSPVVSERYLSRGADELFLPDVRVTDFLRPSTWTMDAFAFPPADVDQYMRSRLLILFGSLLAAKGGVLLHGSGFILDGGAAAVVGPSQAGKTTAARLVQGDRLLSDDVVAVTDINTQPRLHATPFGHESDGVGSAPLRAIFFPRKQPAFSLQPVPARQALIRSAAEQADTFQGLFTPYDGMSIRNLARLFRKVPAYELGFSLDGIDREAIRRVLSGS